MKAPPIRAKSLPTILTLYQTTGKIVPPVKEGVIILMRVVMQETLSFNPLPPVKEGVMGDLGIPLTTIQVSILSLRLRRE